MSAKQLTPILALCLLLVFGHSQGRPAETCSALAASLPMAPPSTMQYWLSSPCPELTIAAGKQWADGLQAALAKNTAPEEAADTRLDFEESVVLARLKLAMLNRDRGAAGYWLAHYLDRSDFHQTRLYGTDSPFSLVRIQRIMEGAERGTLPKVELEGEQPWVVNRGLLTATDDRLFTMQQLESIWPSTTDAWIAVGKPTIGILNYASRYWELNLEVGDLPPDLRSLMERAFGPDTAAQHFQQALASIEVNDDPAKPNARMRLFGHWLPLPVIEHDAAWQDARPEDDALLVFDTVKEPAPNAAYRTARYTPAALRKILQQAWDRSAMPVRLAKYQSQVHDAELIQSTRMVSPQDW